MTPAGAKSAMAHKDGNPAMSAQQKPIKEQLIGAWALVACEIVAPDGRKSPLVVGNNPAGQYIFTADGHFSFQAVAEFDDFQSNDRMKTTPQEDKAVVQG